MQKRIYSICFAIILASIIFGKFCFSGDTPIRSYEERIKMFEYNPGDPLDIKYISRTKQDNAWIHDITFASPKGGPVTAFLVTPTTEGRHPAFIFAHSGGSNRRDFLAEALIFAEAGAVSLLIDDPTARPEPWRRQIFDFNNPEQAREGFIQTIIDLRRCVDLLLKRPDVDPKRIGFVGFSFGATQGGILCGIEQRISAYALMGGGPRLTEFWKDRITGQPGLDEYIQATEPFNVEYYIVHSAPAAVLYHFGTEDRNVPKEEALEFYKTGPTPKDIKWYNSGHNLNSEATYQRIEWFHEKLGTQLLVKGPVTGTWAGTLDGPDGNPLEVTYVFDAIGTILLGTVNTRLGGGPFEEGKIEGNKISFVSKPGPSTIIEMTGTVSGDVIHMTRKNGDKVDEFTLKRVRENKRFDGTWQGTAPGPDGTPLAITYEFESAGNNLSGYVTTRLGGGPFSGGKVEEYNISFSVELPDITVYTNGTLSGDAINMTQKKGDEVTQFTLKRAAQSIPYKEIKVSPEILAQYAGIYKLDPETEATVTVQDSLIFCQITGQPNLRLYPESETKYSFRVSDWSLEFFRDDKGMVGYAVYHQSGNDARLFPVSRLSGVKSPFDGIWKGMLPGPDGTPIEITYEFESFGEDLMGTVSTKLGGGPFSGGKIDGNNISFSVKRSSDDVVYINGSLSGDVIDMTQKTGNGVKRFSLTRVKSNK